MQVSSDQFTFECRSPDQLGEIAEKLIKQAGAHRVFSIYGQMGAGKTTLVQAICRSMGVTDHVTSPTFTLVNEYQSETGDPVFHFDFYRIKNESEALDFGFENYLYSGHYCFIEWPEKVASLLPDEQAVISIDIVDDLRKITLTL